MNLTIVQSILHGALRPNLVDNIDFRHLANLFSKLPNTLHETENLFLNNFSFLPFDFDNERPFNIGEIASDSYTPIMEEHIGKKLDLPLPPFSSPKEKFYQVIVEAETHRIKLAIINYAAIQHSDIDTRKTITDTLKVILQYAKQVEPEADSTLSALRVQLICFYVEMVAIASPLLTQDKDYLSFEDLIYELFSRYPNDDENDKYKNFVASLEPVTENDTPIKTNLPSAEEYEKEKAQTNYEVFVEIVSDYRFEEIDKVKCLNGKQKVKLIRLIVESNVGYSVVMLKYIGYFDLLKNKFNMNKEMIFKHIGKALKKSPRIIKGNYNILNPKSKEDPYVYDSPKYVQQVEDDYKKLQL